MRPRVVTGAAVALTLLGTWASAQDAAPPAHEDDMPRFCAREAHRQQRYYPARAQEQEQEGAVTLDCAISGNALSSCAVVEETNPGWDFGPAALRLACRFTVSTDSDGAPHLSSAPRDTTVSTDAENHPHARSTIRFRLAPASAPPPPPPP